MRGIILAGGKGSRLRPFTYSGAKQLVPIANTPVLHFPVRQLVAVGITEIALVVGETGPQVRDAMGDGSRFGARFTYIEQHAPLGIAHAVGLCREFVGLDRFVVYLGDNVLRHGIRSFALEFADSEAAAAVVLKAVDDPRAFGVARMDGERLREVLEKPLDPPTNLAVTGVYGFSPIVFRIIAAQSPSARGELEIADTINGVIAQGGSVNAMVTTDDWIDTGKMDDILAANRIALADLTGPYHGPALQGSTISGPVAVASDAIIEDCILRGPLVIGEGVRLTRCRIGPDVAIGPGATISDANIANAIIMERSHIDRCADIVDSMIGRDTIIHGIGARVRLCLGDHSRLEDGA